MIYLVRHAESEHNAVYLANSGTYKKTDKYGTPLTKKGRMQATLLAQQLEDFVFHAIYASDMRRSRQTAEILAKKRQIKIIIDERIRERSWGSFEGKQYGETIERIVRLQQGLSDKDKLKVKLSEDMESEWEGATRLHAVLNEIEQNFKEKTALVVSHGNVIRSFLKMIGHAKYHELPAHSIENCGYIILDKKTNSWDVVESYGVNKILL